ncbi:MAG: hypothetical protein ACHQDE_09760 [Acidimicrobiia bacterium]
MCGFDLDHYGDLLAAAEAGAYRFAFFDHEPEQGDLFLRHDVDLSLEAARVLSAFERDRGVGATYFLMTTSVFYNLASPEGEATLAQLRADGHRVGLHAHFPALGLDHRFDPVVTWHNPDPAWMGAPVEGAVNVMGAPWFSTETYRSDSNQNWRNGCPHDEIVAGAFPWLQLLIHPEIWVYSGDSMRETMHSMLDRDRDRRLEQLAADKIDLS